MTRDQFFALLSFIEDKPHRAASVKRREEFCAEQKEKLFEAFGFTPDDATKRLPGRLEICSDNTTG